MSFTKIDDVRLEHLITIKNKYVTEVEEVHLRGNFLTSTVIPVLCNALPNLSKLKMLALHHNLIGSGDPTSTCAAKRLIETIIHNCKFLEHVTFTD